MRRIRATEKRGSLMVEAAVFLPVFLIAVLTLGLLIRHAGTEETVLHAMLNQGRLTSVAAYSALQNSPGAGQAGKPGDNGAGLEGADSPAAENELWEGYGALAGLASRQLYRAGVQTQLARELDMKEDEIELENFRYLYEADGRDHLIAATVRYRGAVPLPRAARKELTGREHLVWRAFAGAGDRRETPPASREDMEEDKESCPVYVFPRAGEKYHRASCPIVTPSPVRRIVTDRLRKQYGPCGMCRASDLKSGGSAYCFSETGRVYHRRTCRAVDRYFVIMERDEAEDRGYLPCARCGGY